MSRATVVGVDAILDYADRIDVRSPSEFAADHLPGAANCPVLDDDERARVGTIYTRESSFVAKKTGAALVSRNIARWLESAFADKERDWRPLVYCWRGGTRSGAMTHVLNEVGWKAAQLDGGYRAYRRRVVADLESLPEQFRFVVVCGLTGSGKSRLLGAMAALGAPQVLDLEAMACHRGSLLGDLPSEPQPSQKRFESRLWERLVSLDPRRPVFVESESRKIGEVQVPEALMRRMRGSECVRIDTPTPLRIALLEDEYRHFLEDPGPLVERLRHLVPLHGSERIGEWQRLAFSGDWDRLVQDLLERHYDPSYERSMQRNYACYPAAQRLAPGDASEDAFAELAQALAERAEG